MKEISNVEIALMEIIAEKKEVSGYEINQLIIERGYREWADIGTTSIYVGLKKIEEKKLVDSFINIEKAGKGPIPRKYKLNSKGYKFLIEEIKQRVKKAIEKSNYQIGLAGLPLLKNEEIIDCLNDRIKYLHERMNYLEQKYKAQGGNKLPIYVKALFDHPKEQTKMEIKFAETLKNHYIKEIKK